MVTDKTAANFSQRETLPPNLNTMKRKGAFKRSVTENRHFNGSVNGDPKLKIARCTPFKVYISNETTGGMNLRD